MTDIVERLRTEAAYVDDGWITHTGEHGHRLLKEAADKIELLRYIVLGEQKLADHFAAELEKRTIALEQANSLASGSQSHKS